MKKILSLLDLEYNLAFLKVCVFIIATASKEDQEDNDTVSL